ncbi:MAG: recombinase RecT, partial [Methylicorpusculum sp.]|nr:recombinase RecT [Methylicorpusculum sp.]
MTGNKQSLFKKFADKFNFKDEKSLTDTLKATAFKVKDGVVTDEQMTALLIVSDQYGLNPFTKEIFAYPDKQNGIVPVVSVDGWSRIINQHPDMDGLEFVYDSTWITDVPDAKPCPASIECVIYRKGRTH